MEQDKELTAAAAGLEKALGSSFDGAAALGAEKIGDDICKIYHDAKPWLEKIANLLDIVPIPWAKPLAKGLRMLMMIADQFCPKG
jgi:hypothetical protein